MIKPVELYRMACIARKREAEGFVSAFLPELEESMKVQANNGAFEMVIDNNSNLAKTGVLRSPYFYEALKEVLEKEAFQVEITDDKETGKVFKIKWNVEGEVDVFDISALESIEIDNEAHYKNDLQIRYIESLCEKPLEFYHGTEESYSEISVFVKKEFDAKNVATYFEVVLRKQWITKPMVKFKAYKTGQIVMLLDLKLFTVAQIQKLMNILKSLITQFVTEEKEEVQENACGDAPAELEKDANDSSELEVVETGEEAHYKNLLQLQFLEALCKQPLHFFHHAENSYPEIVIYILKGIAPSLVGALLQKALKEKGFKEEMVEIEPYDDGDRGYNELVVLLDLKEFTVTQIQAVIKIILEEVQPHASNTAVEYSK